MTPNPIGDPGGVLVCGSFITNPFVSRRKEPRKHRQTPRYRTSEPKDGKVSFSSAGRVITFALLDERRRRRLRVEQRVHGTERATTMYPPLQPRECRIEQELRPPRGSESVSEVPPGARYRGDGCDREAVNPAHPAPRCSRHLPAAAVDGGTLHKPTEQPRLSEAGGE